MKTVKEYKEETGDDIIQIPQLSSNDVLKYINGQNTVTYFGIVLFSEEDNG